MNKLRPDYCPEWFDLTNYEFLKYFHRSSWSVFVFYKRLVFKSLKEGNNYLPEYNKSLDAGMITYTFENGQQLCNDEKEDLDIITEVDFQDFVFKYQDILLSNNQEQKDFLEELRGECLSFSPKFSDEITQEYIESVMPMNYLEFPENINRLDNFDDHIFSVNLAYSDEVLLATFKEKLAKLRSKKQIKGKRISDFEINSLIEHRVVPYIDLMLWGMLTGENLTQAQIANLLFPELTDIDVVAKLRQTTIPKALNLLKQVRPKFI
ncbi:DUF6387 family protein [Rodentibacter caecimuris]|uniref:DUF6387 family protein n=1 Tax=Rodentibacter caecimuris TaxID=1796644 RepID=UPI0013A098D9|nr:DUF6387 family protein [Rodentibacter heylii]QIA77679.1 hypothetical protein FEE42_10170 [Rodentibacter heylii]